MSAKAQTVQHLQRYQGLAGLALLLIVAAVLNQTFFTTQNLANIVNQVAIPGTLALGMTLVILSGGIDLSVGSHTALIACVVALMTKAGYGLPAIILAAIGLAAAIGLVIGWLISATRMQPFVVTLAAMVSLRGVVFLITKNNVSGLGDTLKPFQESWLGVPAPAWLLLVLTAILALAMQNTPWGRRIYAVGGNAEAARTSGVNVHRIRISVYAANGVFVGITGILLVARTRIGEPGGAMGYELDAIAAAVVGGASLLGGIGNVLGSLVGALFIASMNVLIVLQGIDDKIGMGLKGPIILLAVALQRWGR